MMSRNKKTPERLRINRGFEIGDATPKAIIHHCGPL